MMHSDDPGLQPLGACLKPFGGKQTCITKRIGVGREHRIKTITDDVASVVETATVQQRARPIDDTFFFYFLCFCNRRAGPNTARPLAAAGRALPVGPHTQVSGKLSVLSLSRTLPRTQPYNEEQITLLLFVLLSLSALLQPFGSIRWHR